MQNVCLNLPGTYLIVVLNESWPYEHVASYLVFASRASEFVDGSHSSELSPLLAFSYKMFSLDVPDVGVKCDHFR